MIFYNALRWLIRIYKIKQKKCLNERKSGLEVQQNVWMVEKDKINWRKSENLRYWSFHCAKQPTMALAYKTRRI